MLFDLLDGWLVPADADVDAMLRTADPRTLLAICSTYNLNRAERRRLDFFPGDTEIAFENTTHRDIREHYQRELDRRADITPAQSLAANAQLAEWVDENRFMMTVEAREAGDSWTTIGDAQNISKQGALDWYKRKLAEHDGNWMRLGRPAAELARAQRQLDARD